MISHGEKLKAFVRAWQRALEFLAENPQEGYQIMADGVGGWLADPAEFEAVVTGVEYLDIDRNKEMFGSGRCTRTIAQYTG